MLIAIMRYRSLKRVSFECLTCYAENFFVSISVQMKFCTRFMNPKYAIYFEQSRSHYPGKHLISHCVFTVFIRVIVSKNVFAAFNRLRRYSICSSISHRFDMFNVRSMSFPWLCRSILCTIKNCALVSLLMRIFSLYHFKQIAINVTLPCAITS